MFGELNVGYYYLPWQWG